MATQQLDGDGNALLIESLRSLEKRVQHLENLVQGGRAIDDQEEERGLHSLKFGFSSTPQGKESILESRVGEYGLALVGSVVLLFGITFLARYFQNSGRPVIGVLAGYLAAGSIFFLAHYLRRSFTQLSYMLNLSSFVVVYYITLQMHFFTTTPLIGSKYLIASLLLLTCGIQIFYSITRKAAFTSAIGLVMILFTALLVDEKHLSLLTVTAVAILSIYLFAKAGWFRILVFGLIVVYLTHLLWLLGNPLAGGPMKITDASNYNIAYLFAPGLLFSMILSLKNKVDITEYRYNAIVILNGMGFSFVLMVTILGFYQDAFTSIFLFIFMACFAFSMYLKTQTTFKFSAAFFVCYAFFALSVAVYGFALLPDSFLLLALQSLLVVSMALWFRSQIIVMMNIFLFTGLLLAYFAIAQPDNWINFTFALVALVTARILNWKKERLTLKTELLRNIYLFTGFIMVLVSLYHAVPGKYITLSWSAAAVFFFLLSIILKNVKYRWLALGVLLITVCYLFLFDLAHLEVGIRVVAFLLFGVISIGASLYYTKKIKGKSADPE